jgi:hypothetical protein
MSKIIKRFFSLAFFTLIISMNGFSQSGKVPPFRIMQTDGKVFLAGNLPMGDPIIIIYFSPDCEDCQKLIEGLIFRMNDFKNASIVMITYLPLKNVSQFVIKNKLNTYSNIFIGTEASSLFVRNYYNVISFPFISLYNMNGDLIKIYREECSLDDLAKQLKNL